MRVRVFRREGNNQYYFQFLRDDGQVILNSEGYTTEAARDNGVQSVINNSGNADRYETRTNDAGGFYFILKAGNNQEIGRSVTFRNEGGRDAAVTLMQGEAAGVQGGGGATTTAATVATGAATIEPYKAKGDEDDYKPLNFYETNGGGTAEGFDSFSAEDEHYFSYNLGGTVYLISEGYNSIGARDNGVQSVTNNMTNADRYQRQQHPNGKFFFNLKAGNNREIATSRWFDNQGEMDAIIARIVGGTGGGRRVQEGTQLTAANRDANISIAAPPPPRDMGQPKKKRKKRTTPKKPKAEKVYVGNGNYLFNDVTYQIFRSGNNRYYFTFKNKEEKTLFLNSDVRGFETQEEAEAKIAQIMLYAPYEENFEGKQARNGKYYFYIKGEEGKNIGKSFFYGTSEDMQKSVGLLLGNEAQIAALAGGGGATAAAGATAGGDDAIAAKGNVDEYLACSAYASDTDGFTKFKHDENGEFYFGYNHGGKTYLRSEGYTAEKSRDNGIESVTKNAPNDARWKTMKDEDDGMWYYSLKAGNNQEIARSCGYESEAAMNTAWGWIRGEESPMGAGAQYIGGVWYSGAWVRRKQEEEAAAKRAAEAAAAKKAEEEAAAKRAAEAAAAKKAEEEAAAKRAAAAAAKRAEEEATARRAAQAAAAKKAEEEASAKKAAAVAAAATAAAALAATKKKEEAEALAFAAKEEKVEKVVKVVKEKDKEDDYLPCKAYEGHAVNDKINNIAFFRAGDDNQYYFALYNEDGSVRLRSEGFKTAKERDEELSGVVRLKDNKEFYKRIEKGKYFLEILYDESGREVGRSCLNEVAAAAPVVKKDKEDDYLPCKTYEGHAVNDKINNIAFFKGEDNQFYFAAYDDNGNVKLRSEGFKTAKERDEELSGVVRLKNNKDYYKRIEKGKYYMDILYDETGREVGRSCLRNAEEEAKVIAAAKAKKEKAAAAAAATAAAALAATRKKEEEEAKALAFAKAEKEKVAAAAVTKKKAAAAKVVTTAKKEKVVATAAATTEGSGTWWWLPWLLIPLLLAMLWFTKGCYGCDDTARPTPMDVSSVVVPPVQKVAPPAAPTCACNNTDCSVMNLPANGRAQILTRLGTNPEFGNAHGLTGPQFLGRLRNRYATEAADKKFLDDLFGCMGYTNGFADATADMFSEVTLPNGKTGNMGHGKNHGTSYTTLNARDAKDLEAYRIKAANGCDVHFMKTCGNHFFFCN